MADRPPAANRRFVLLWHAMPGGSDRNSHFDLMLEEHGQLRTWALDRVPQRGEGVEASQLAPHRLEYLQFEGEISGNRGSVRRIDQGSYAVIASKQGSLVIEMQGGQLSGTWEFRQFDASQCWLIKRIDDFANL